MKKLTLLPLLCTALVACGSGQSGSTSTDSTASDSTATAGVVTTDSIVPYRLAENYFVTSDSLPSTLTTAEEQGKYLGMATSMGNTPTTIDWSREFVIPIALPPHRYRNGDYPRIPHPKLLWGADPHLSN